MTKHDTKLKDILDDSILNKRILCAAPSNTFMKYSGYVEIEVLDYVDDLVKLKFWSTLPTYMMQGDIQWCNLLKVGDYEIIKYIDETQQIHG